MAKAEGPYSGRFAALATMHGKEGVIAPLLRQRLGLRIFVPTAIDTDALGTFTGEIARPGDMLETAVQKARLGMKAMPARIGIASEGSYGPHPHIPLIPGGLELMVLVDDDRGIVVTETLVEDRPCFEHCTARPGDDIAAFLARIGFPAQAVTVRANEAGKVPEIAKGIRDKRKLANAISLGASKSADGLALVQTDMRAHMNPTRMATIEKLADRFSTRLARLCPACDLPGFGRIGAGPGLACKWCGGTTIVTSGELMGCVECDHRKFKPRGDGLLEADPCHCPRCNP